MSLATAARAGAWSAADVVLRQGVGFLVLMVMARLLTPEDFGVVALVTFFSNLSIVFVQGGLSQAMIQRQQTSLDEESAVFWWNLGGSAAMGAILLLLAGPIAAFYDLPIIQPLMVLAAAQIVLAALGAVQTALLSRSLDFRRLTGAGLVASLASGTVGIAAAWQGLGVWALGLQIVTLAGINSLALWLITPWRPRWHARFATIRGLWSFGIYLSLASLLDVIYTQGFSLVIGKLHGVADLGIYNRAHSTQALPSNVLGSIVGRIAFPLFSARADDHDALRRGVRLANALASVINLPAMVGLALLADLVIVVLFGEQWRGAAPILSILALAGILMPLHIVNLQLLLAKAQSKRFLQLELIKKGVGLTLIVIGSISGITGLAWATVLASVATLPLNASGVKRMLGYGPLRQLADLADLLLPTAAMVGAIVVARPLLVLAPPAQLACLVVGGAAVYAGVGLLLGTPTVRHATTVGLHLVRGTPPP